MVTDYDCWKDDCDAVEVGDIVRVLNDNAARGRSLVAAVASMLDGRPAPCPEGCDRVLDTAVLTPTEARAPEAASRLDAVAGRIL
jgi:5'-methylthioadenosine phosphorylase